MQLFIFGFWEQQKPQQGINVTKKVIGPIRDLGLEIRNGLERKTGCPNII